MAFDSTCSRLYGLLMQLLRSCISNVMCLPPTRHVVVCNFNILYILLLWQLLLLEKWFRSDAQEDTRRHLHESRERMHQHLRHETAYEDRIYKLQGMRRLLRMCV